MSKTLVEKFLEKRKQKTVCIHDSFENAFYLPKMEKQKKTSLKNTSELVKPTHIIQRSPIFFNENIQNISHNTIIKNIEKIIEKKKQCAKQY